MLRLLTGKARSGKSQYIFEQIQKQDLAGDKVYLIVPEQFTMEAEYELSQRLEKGVLLGVEVISFERMAFRLVDNARGRSIVKIDDHGKVMVLRRLFNLYKKDMQVFKRATQKEGFLTEFKNLIQELKRNRIRPETLEEALKAIENPLLGRKIQDVLQIYQAFEEFMQGRYLDDEDRFEALIEAIDYSKMFQSAHVWVDHFHGFTVQERAVLAKIMEKAACTTVSLTLDADENRDQSIFASTIRTFKHLKKMAETMALEVKWQPFQRDSEETEMAVLEKELFSYPFKTYEKPVETLSLYAGQNMESEVEHMAMTIIDLAQTQGYRWRDMTVIKGTEAYNPILKRIFSEYGIPYFMDEKRGIMHSPVIQFLMSALTCIDRYYRQEDIVRLLKVGLIDLAPEAIEQFENGVLAYGIQGRKFLQPMHEKYENRDQLEVVRQQLSDVLVPFHDVLKKAENVEDMTRALYTFMVDNKLPEKIQEWLRQRKEEGALEHAQEMTQIWNILMTILDQMIELMGDQEIRIKEFIKLLEAGLKEYQVGIIPTTVDHVLVGSVNRSKSHSVKAIFVLGMNDGLIPAYSEGDGILLNEEKQGLAEYNLQLPSTRELKQQEEDLAVYALLNKASERIYLSCALADEKGNTLRPSILIEKLQAVFPKLSIQSDLIQAFEEAPSLLPAPAFKFLIKELRQWVEGKEMDAFWWSALRWYQEQETWQKQMSLVIEGLFHNNQPISLKNEEVEALYNLPLVVSTSRLEKYADCPFAHFVRYGLKPKMRKMYKVEYPDIGLLFHTSVERFARYLKTFDLSWKDLEQEEIRSIIDTIIDELAEDHDYKILQSSYRYKYLIHKIRRITNRAIGTLGHQLGKGQFELMDHEVAFGTSIVQGSIPPLVIEMEDGQRLMIEGRIDRIDIFEQGEKKYVKIIDYKSGLRKFNLSEVFFGLQIQLVLYLDAVVKNSHFLLNDALNPGGIFYFRIDDPLIETDGRTSEADIEKAIRKSLRMDGLAVKNLEVVQAIDDELQSSGKSDVIPVALKKDESFSATSSVMEEADMALLMAYTEDVAKQAGESITHGEIGVSPCKTRDYVACQRCDYQSLCQFDSKLRNNQYRLIQNLSNERVLDKLHEWSEKHAKVDTATESGNSGKKR